MTYKYDNETIHTYGLTIHEAETIFNAQRNLRQTIVLHVSADPYRGDWVNILIDTGRASRARVQTEHVLEPIRPGSPLFWAASYMSAAIFSVAQLAHPSSVKAPRVYVDQVRGSDPDDTAYLNHGSIAYMGVYRDDHAPDEAYDLHFYAEHMPGCSQPYDPDGTQHPRMSVFAMPHVGYVYSEEVWEDTAMSQWNYTDDVELMGNLLLAGDYGACQLLYTAVMRRMYDKESLTEDCKAQLWVMAAKDAYDAMSELTHEQFVDARLGEYWEVLGHGNNTETGRHLEDWLQFLQGVCALDEHDPSHIHTMCHNPFSHAAVVGMLNELPPIYKLLEGWYPNLSYEVWIDGRKEIFDKLNYGYVQVAEVALQESLARAQRCAMSLGLGTLNVRLLPNA